MPFRWEKTMRGINFAGLLTLSRPRPKL